jgi:hypothetical protein
MDTTLMRQNIFDIPFPDECTCRLETYALTHKVLCIRVTSPLGSDEDLHLFFGRVFYYAGPTYWLGANFRFATDQEYEDLMKEVGLSKSEGKEFSLVLYVATQNEKVISKILSVYGNKEDKNGSYPAVIPSNSSIQPT